MPLRLPKFGTSIDVRPGEYLRCFAAFVYLFSAVGAFITARIAKSSLFLEIPNYRDQLPLTYIGVALTVSLVMSQYAKVERSLRRDHTNLITLAGIICVTLLFRYALDVERSIGWFIDNPKHEVYWFFLIWVEVLGTLLIVQFWSLVPEIFTSRQAKRLFIVIGGGGVLANIAFGFGVKTLVPLIGTENLLFLICACLCVSGGAVTLLGVNARAELRNARQRAPSVQRTKQLNRTRHVATEKLKTIKDRVPNVFTIKHVQLIAAVVVVIYLVSTIVDYQFNVIVAQEINGKDNRSAFFAEFFQYTGIIAACIQFFLTGRILERFGVLVALLLLPCAMFFGTAAILTALMLPLAAATLTKGSENVLRYTVNDSTLQLLYIPVPSAIRGRAKALIDGVLKPVSVGIAGFILALLVGKLDDLLGISLGFVVDVHQLSWLVAAGLVTWVILLIFLRKEYVQSLVNTLHRRRLDFSDSNFQIANEGTIRILERSLNSDKDGHVLHTLELISHVTKSARPRLHRKLATLLQHPSVDIRVAVLHHLAEYDKEERPEVEACLESNSSEVVAAAVKAYCASRREKAATRINTLLSSPYPGVQEACVSSLIKHGGLDGVLATADRLKTWLHSEDATQRCTAARILGDIGVENFYQPLIPLLADSCGAVRAAAIEAAGKLRNPELLEPVLGHLNDPKLASVCMAAISSFGEEAEQALFDLIQDPGAPIDSRVRALKIKGRIGNKGSVVALTLLLEAGSLRLRSAAAHSLSAITKRWPGVDVNRAQVSKAIASEVKRWYANTLLEFDLKLQSDSVLLQDSIRHRRRLVETQILTLLGLKYPSSIIELIVTNIYSQQRTTRANALEVLDNVLDKDEKQLILTIFEAGAVHKKVELATETLELQHRSKKQVLLGLLNNDDPWLQNCVVTELVAQDMKEAVEPLKLMLKSDYPVNRETAVYGLSKLLDKKELAEALTSTKKDSHELVQRFTNFVLQDA
jgi:ATP/ADP translocase/HEAT repeat protein